MAGAGQAADYLAGACGDDERWAVRAAIDAVVADAYGLSRDQYAHVLSTFSHASYPKAPELCLARFDELKAIGLEAFTKKYDPYWDIPLNESTSPSLSSTFRSSGRPVVRVKARCSVFQHSPRRAGVSQNSRPW